MLLNFLLLLSSLMVALTNGFGAAGPGHRRDRISFLKDSRAHSQRHNALTMIKSASSTSTTTTTTTTNVKNIFQDYTSTEKPIVLLGSSSSNQEIKHLATFLSKSLGTNIVSSVDQASSLDILVLDFSTDTDIHDYTHMAQSLYQDHNLLSIYINVLGQDDDKEDHIFIPFSDYELCIQDEIPHSQTDPQPSDDWSHVQWELTRLLARALLPPAIPGDKTQSANTAHLTMGQHSFFLSLSFPEIQQVQPYVSQMCRDVDAMEYRTDLLTCRDSRFHLIRGQQLLRKYCRPHAHQRAPGLPFLSTVLEDVFPICYTVRTQHQAGTYPDDEQGIDKMFQLLEWGLRSGTEILDVEAAWDPEKTNALLHLAQQRYSSQILGSHHVVGQETSLEEAVQLFQQCALQGRAHGTKVVLSITNADDDALCYQAALISQSLAAQDGKPVLPSISLILGEVGQFSRILNFPFTPVTHESLPAKAAPGQLTANEIMTTRILTRLVQSQKYCILGHNIAYSVSPAMHSAAFEAVRLPHAYTRADVETVEEFAESDFFKTLMSGASVTIPHKQSIMKYVDELSDAARTIQSVNTLVVRERMRDDDDDDADADEEAETMQRYIYGDNTDWKGMYNPLARILGRRDTEASSPDQKHALICGAGGTARAAAYTAQQLGLKCLFYNPRTPEKARELCNSFGSKEEDDDDDTAAVLSSLEDTSKYKISVVISTFPAAVNFVLPESFLEQQRQALKAVLDVNYKPYATPLLDQILGLPPDRDDAVRVVRGSEMLWEQGIGQFELWTERTAPYAIMKSVVLENCVPKEKSD